MKTESLLHKSMHGSSFRQRGACLAYLRHRGTNLVYADIRRRLSLGQTHKDAPEQSGELATRVVMADLLYLPQRKAIGVDPATGTLLWEREFVINNHTNSITPVLLDNVVIVGGNTHPMTAFAVVLMRQSNVPASDPRVQRSDPGVLADHPQRASGAQRVIVARGIAPAGGRRTSGPARRPISNVGGRDRMN